MEMTKEMEEVTREFRMWVSTVTQAFLKVGEDIRALDERVKQLEEEVAWNKHQLGLDQAERSA